MELSTGEFLTAFLSLTRLFFPESGSPAVQPDDTASPRPSYDYIIVGAGSAGCVLANRLTEDPKTTVLLIEAGGDENAISEAPHLHSMLHNTDLDWNYTTVRQKKACLNKEGLCSYPRGRVMGGSSTINAMMYVRGHWKDFENWAEVTGEPGWNYPHILPYFIKSENNTIAHLGSSPYHGTQGYLNVGYSQYLTNLTQKYLQAGVEFGWEEGDYNGEKQESIGILQHTFDGPSRESTSKAFLNPIKTRPNLSVTKRSLVTKLLIDGMHVKGVEFFKNGDYHQVFTNNEVILSAGSIDTPKILMLSGIGPKEELSKHNIPIVADLPVGKYLKDHLMFSVFFDVLTNETIKTSDWRSIQAIKEYAIGRRGPLTSTGAETVTFLNVFNKTEPPNLQIFFLSNDAFSETDSDSSTIQLLLCGVYPKSLGTVKLSSNSWKDPPLIDPNYFDEEEDLEVFKEGIKLALNFMKTPTMAALSPQFKKDAYPECSEADFKTFDAYLECIVKSRTATIYHPVSTARMGGPDEESVLTPELLVRGFDNLRVIDASVMPDIVRGNTNAAVILIAEKGADLVKGVHGKRKLTMYNFP